MGHPSHRGMYTMRDVTCAFCGKTDLVPGGWINLASQCTMEPEMRKHMRVALAATTLQPPYTVIVPRQLSADEREECLLLHGVREIVTGDTLTIMEYKDAEQSSTD